MRETNFCFPPQNRAAVCISSQLYDRRALDTNSALPLHNSLTHLGYLTSTSPRIREIMTMDGGLERLIRILHDFCLSPPPPENPNIYHGLLPINFRPPKQQPTLNPRVYDRAAAARFSLAFQCVVNIGVRGSEPIRSRVVQAGALDVVGCILEAWLLSKGYSLGPSSSATGLPRESREQRQARRQAQAEQRSREQREQAALLSRALEQQQLQQDVARVELARIRRTRAIHPMDLTSEATIMPSSPSPANDASDQDTSADPSATQTPAGSNTPTGTVEVPGRDRSGTVIARPVWDRTIHQPTAGPSHAVNVTATRRPRAREQQLDDSAPTSRDTSRPETETEDDGEPEGDGDVDMDRARASDGSPEPRIRPTAAVQPSPLVRRAVGIVSDDQGASLELASDAHIIISQDPDLNAEGVGVQDGLVSLEANDDFAMGAPPGAPGAIDAPRTIRPPDVPPTVRRVRGGPAASDATPRAGAATLPGDQTEREDSPGLVGPGAPLQRPAPLPMTNDRPVFAPADPTPAPPPRRHHHHHHHEHEGPYRDEDVLLSLQLLAYLSKYPHVRQAFYQQRTSFHPAAQTAAAAAKSRVAAQAQAGSSTQAQAASSSSSSSNFFKSLTARGKEKEPVPPPIVVEEAGGAGNNRRMTNVFSLVERFTFRVNVTESEMPNPPPAMPQEIQYWAGVIMRNACRKDESRGGIRQCANMLCGRWETYPREFAKCRRCRKAKYCGKECQSTAWSEGHRFWCSAKDGDDDAHEHAADTSIAPARARVRATAAAAQGDALVARTVAGVVGETPRRRADTMPALAMGVPPPVARPPGPGPDAQQREREQGFVVPVREADGTVVGPPGAGGSVLMDID